MEEDAVNVYGYAGTLRANSLAESNRAWRILLAKS